MICEIVSIGTELLLGDITDTNARYLSQRMKEFGFSVYHRQTCGDNRERIKEVLSLALSRADLVFVTGGLGPTYDDITREVAADLFETELLENEEAKAQIVAYFARRGLSFTENNLRQAMVPKGARILQNDWGTAPGLWLEKNKKGMILLPGVPYEMEKLFCERVKPELEKRAEGEITTEVLHLYGISEAKVDKELFDLMQKGQNPSIAPYAGGGEVELHITARAENKADADAMCNAAKQKVLARLGKFCYGEGDASLEKELVRELLRQGKTIATAESCTGGLVSQRITSVSGASSVLETGVCAYSERIKQKILSVSEKTLKEKGVYSEECALEMAKGVRALSQSDLGVGITGVAGPSGGTEKSPVGTVYIAVCDGDGEEVISARFGDENSDRAQIRARAASRALSLTRSFLLKNAKNIDKIR